MGNMDSEAARQVDAIFGFGRRVCPGKTFAETNVWLLMANIVATMNIEKSVDKLGQPITPNTEYIGSYVRYVHPHLVSGISVFSLMAHHSRHVKPFTCKMTYRSEKARAIVEQTKMLHA